MIRLAAFAILAICVTAAAASAEARDRKVRAEFQRLNPCPATGERRGPCPGLVVDHIAPLCAGGPDITDNMQWQTVEASRAKDTEERRRCRTLRRSH